MKKVNNFNFKEKRVLLRCDFNVPISEGGEILDDFRISQTIPTIEYLVKKEAKVILMSHLGRPEDREEKYSLRPVAERLEKLSKKKVKLLPDCIGKEVQSEIDKMKPKDIVLLENLRFHKEEEANDERFAKELSKLGDIYLNDAFSVCHRSHASVVGITKFLPAGVGFLLMKEIEVMNRILKNPKRPLLVIIGGNKVEDKAKVIERFSGMADFLLVGDLVAEEIKKNKIRIKNMKKIFFPIENKRLLDIDEKTVRIFKEKIKNSKTIFWAGPLGKIEEKRYQKGTKEIAKAIIKSGAFSVVGGGETIEFLNKIGLSKKFSHISTGGSAMLEFLAGGKLPGIEVLK